MKLSNRLLLRHLVLPIFAKINPGDITIKHHYTGRRIRLHSFKHKGYWWHGRRREKETMELFAKLLQVGDSVIEVGGHIGYISLFLKHLCGQGRVIVFEPGENNLPYIRANISGTGIELVESAVGNDNGRVDLYIEDLSGQNNSCVPDFEGYSRNRASAGFGARPARVKSVAITRLDEFAITRSLSPAFVKIDIEGFE